MNAILLLCGLALGVGSPGPDVMATPAPEPGVAIRCTVRRGEVPTVVRTVACEVTTRGRTSTFGKVSVPDRYQLDFMASPRGDLVTALRVPVPGARTLLSFWDNGSCRIFVSESVDDPAMTERNLRPIVQELPEGVLSDLALVEAKAQESRGGPIAAVKGMFGGVLRAFLPASSSPLKDVDTIPVTNVQPGEAHSLDGLFDRLMVRLSEGTEPVEAALAAIRAAESPPSRQAKPQSRADEPAAGTAVPASPTPPAAVVPQVEAKPTAAPTQPPPR